MTVRSRTAWLATLASVIGTLPGFSLPFGITLLLPDRSQTDAFLLTVAAATFVANLLGGSLEVILLGANVRALEKGPAAARSLTRTYAWRLGATAAALGGLATVIMSTRVTTSVTTAVALAIFPVVVVISSVVGSSLYSFDRFQVVSYTQGMRGVSALILAGASTPAHLTTEGAALGLVIGETMRLIILHQVQSKQLRLREAAVGLKPRQQDAADPALLRPVLLQILSMLIFGISPLIDSFVASMLGVGSVTVVSLSERLFFVPLTLLTSGLSTVLAASWARLRVSGQNESLRSDFTKAQRLAALVISGASLIGAVLLLSPIGETLEKLLAVPRLSTITAIYLVGLPFAFSNLLSARLLQVLPATKWLLISAGLGALINLAADLLAAPLLGVAGIALSSTVVRAATASVVLWACIWELGRVVGQNAQAQA